MQQTKGRRMSDRKKKQFLEADRGDARERQKKKKQAEG